MSCGDFVGLGESHKDFAQGHGSGADIFQRVFDAFHAAGEGFFFKSRLNESHNFAGGFPFEPTREGLEGLVI